MDGRRASAGGTAGGASAQAAGWRDLRIPGYEAYAVIGIGGHAAVVRGRQLSCNRTVAIKLLTRAAADERTRRRFDNERAAMGRLGDHPNVVLVVDSGFRDDGIPYLVMEYLPGGSLAAAVKRDGRMGWQKAVSIGVKLAGALQTAHDRKILHRDIKPENVLFSATDEPKLGDFGIARAVGKLDGGGAPGLTVSQAAPETFDSRFSPRSDVYSLASSIMTLLLGHPPFMNGDEDVVPLGRIANEPPPNLRRLGVPRLVCEALEKAMAKDPMARQHSAAQLGEDLRKAQLVSGLAPTPMVVLPRLSADEATTQPPPHAPPLDPEPVPKREPARPRVVHTETAPVPVGAPGSAKPDWSQMPTSDPPWGAEPVPARPIDVPPAPPPPMSPPPFSPPPVSPPPPAPRPAPAAPASTDPGDGVVVPPGSVVIYQSRSRPPSPPRGSGLRTAVVLFACVAVLAAGMVGAAAYAGQGYFVGADGRQVAIYKGRPGGLLFFKPHTVEPTAINLGELASGDANAILDGVRRNSLAAAQQYVSTLSTTTTTTAATTPTTPPSTVSVPTTTRVTTSPSGTGSTILSGVGPVGAGRVVVPAFKPSISFDVKDGWRVNVKPREDVFEMESAGGSWHLTFLTVRKVYNSRGRPLTITDALAGVQAAPSDLVDWLTNHSQLRVTNSVLAATPTGARSMRQLDATIPSGYAYEGCNDPCVLLFRMSDDPPAVKLATERIRFYVVTTASETVVAMASTKDANFDALNQVVGPIMRSLSLSN